MRQTEIERQQANLLSPNGPLYNRPAIIHTPQRKGICTAILQYEEDVIRWALGDFGLRLRDFASSVDLAHPDLQSEVIFDEERSKQFSEVLQLADFAKKNDLYRSIEGLAKLHTKSLPSDLRFLDSPLKNQQYVRLLPTREERDTVRLTKSMREIDLRSFYKLGQLSWDGMPNDFSIYCRHNTTYKDELVKAERKAERYRALGCLEMAARIEESIVEFREIMEENYYGFHRLTMTNAAVILAKMHEFHLISPGEKFLNHPLAEDTTANCYAILVQSKHFKNYQFDENERQFYFYRPRAYPLAEFKKRPKKIEKLIESLESFEDANGKAIFDHFVVVVPSVCYPEVNNQEEYTALDTSGKKKVFSNYLDVNRMIDTNLIKKKAVTPILLGEKDGKCYFVCYWTI